MKKVKKKIFFLLELMFISILLCSCYDTNPIEDVGILIGVGYDIEITDGIVKFVDPAEIPIISESKRSSSVFTGKGNTIYTLVENRMTKMNTRFTLGTELITLISEERAKYGIEDIIDEILRDPKSNLNQLITINKGKCQDYFDITNDNNETNSEILYNLCRLAHLSNFFPKGITISDFFQMYFQEGRKIYLPYIELANDKPQITGIALFNDDKMVLKISIEEAKLLNLLRNEQGKGYLYLSAGEDLEYFDIESFDQYFNIISYSPIKYIDFYGKSRRKVKVSMIDNRLKYDISVNISGNILTNTIIKQKLDKKTIKLIENVFTNKMQKQLNDEVSKIQCTYQDDFLDLGKYAVAKYGRLSEYSSKEYFQNSIINVKVNFTIDSVGRNSKN